MGAEGCYVVLVGVGGVAGGDDVLEVCVYCCCRRRLRCYCCCVCVRARVV